MLWGQLSLIPGTALRSSGEVKAGTGQKMGPSFLASGKGPTKQSFSRGIYLPFLGCAHEDPASWPLLFAVCC